MIGKEGLSPLSPEEVRPKVSRRRSREILNRARSWIYEASNWGLSEIEAFARQAQVEKTRGLILQNPRPSDLARVPKNKRR